ANDGSLYPRIIVRQGKRDVPALSPSSTKVNQLIN
ncbi:MAG: hypothetical protein ACI9RP_002851, partial [Cyclobacteriaceae bacterium]